MDFLKIAARVALTQPLSDQPDYGSKESVESKNTPDEPDSKTESDES